MNSNLFFENDLNIYYILIGSGLFLSFSLYYLIRNNYIAIPSKNVEVFTQEEIDANSLSLMEEHQFFLYNEEMKILV